MFDAKKKIVGHIVAMVITTLMVAVATFVDEKEIIFPEIAALVTGAFCTSKQPWNVSKTRFVLIMSLSSVIGVLLSSLTAFILVKIIIGFICSSVALYLFRCSLVPAISACILPILMDTTELVYPATVCVLSVIIVLSQHTLEKLDLRQMTPFINEKEDLKKYALHWCVLLVSVGAYAVYPTVFNRLLLLAPPLIVMFCEFMSWEKKFDNKEWKIWLAVVLCAVIGAGGRYLFCSVLGVGQILTVIAIQIVIYILFYCLNCYFPPAAALSILPLIIDENQLKYYPIYILITATLITVITVIKRKISDKSV